MSVDTVNYALSTVRMDILKHPDTFSPEGYRKMLAICDCMRSYLIVEDVPGFDWYVNQCLAKHPDSTDFILEELFNQLMVADRDGLSKELAEV